MFAVNQTFPSSCGKLWFIRQMTDKDNSWARCGHRTWNGSRCAIGRDIWWCSVNRNSSCCRGHGPNPRRSRFGDASANQRRIRPRGVGRKWWRERSYWKNSLMEREEKKKTVLVFFRARQVAVSVSFRYSFESLFISFSRLLMTL